MTEVPQNGCCPSGYHKVYLVIGSGINKRGEWYLDYHWYRLDSNNKWSHKRGRRGKVTNLDASVHLITDPASADKDYSKEFTTTDPNYFKKCGALCAKSS